MASRLKGVLDQVLQFEKTYCPFQRTFSVELPKQPETPIKKIPWTPKHLPTSTKSLDTEVQGSVGDIGPSNADIGSSTGVLESSTNFTRALEGIEDVKVGKPVSGAAPTADSGSLTVEPGARQYEKHTEAMDSGQTNNSGSIALCNNSPPATVAAIVDDIHGRFGHFTTLESLDAYQFRSTVQRAHTDVRGASLRVRRHSFDSFMKRSSRVAEENPFLGPLMMANSGNDGYRSRRPPTRSGNSLHTTQSTKSTSALEELSRKRSKPDLKLPDEEASQISNMGNTRGLQAPLLAATTNSMTSQPGQDALDSEVPRLCEPFESSRSLSSVDDAAEYRTPSIGIVQPLSQSEYSRKAMASNLRLRNTPEAQAPPASPAGLISREESIHKPAPFPVPTQRPSLPMNIISKTYDALLLPLAYIIAFMLKVLTRLLFVRRREPLQTARQYDDQVPAFLQYSEDELTE